MYELDPVFLSWCIEWVNFLELHLKCLISSRRVWFYEYYACTLFDSGASQSFVFATFARMCKLVREPLPQSMVMVLPNRETTCCSKVTLGCPLDFGERTLDPDLIVFKLFGFDIILGMDLLFRHFVSINCWSCVVSFHLPVGDYMKFVGSKLKSRPTVISGIQAKKDLASGADAYLVQVVSNPPMRKSVAGIPVIEEFSDVFVDDLPGLPLVHDVEFTIDLEPGAALVHKAPYRMAPTE